MRSLTLAKRYARALLDVAKERGIVDRVEQELHAVAATWSAAPELRALVRHPGLDRARKRAAIENAFRGRVCDLLARFLDLLVEKDRFDAIEDIARLYDDLSDEWQGIARAHVTVYAELTDAQRRALIERLQKFTDRPKVMLRETVDPDILGGIVVRIGDEVIDGSVRGRLARLRERLIVREAEREAAAMVAASGRGGAE